MMRLDARGEPFDGEWAQEITVLETPPDIVVPPGRESVSAPSTELPAIFGHAPDWKAIHALKEDVLTRPLAPSRPDGVQYGAEPPTRSPLDRVAAFSLRKSGDLASAGGTRAHALARGTLVHRLLQYLPDQLPERRRGMAERFLARPGLMLSEAEQDEICISVLAVLSDPALQDLFAPGSLAEQVVTGIAFGHVVLGQVDRLRITERVVTICDFKTNRTPPRAGAMAPIAYRRQMAAYRAVLAQRYPDREIRCVIVWTEGPMVMPLGDEDLAVT